VVALVGRAQRDRALSGLPAATRSSGISIPWSALLRSRCTSGSPSSSMTCLSTSVSPPDDLQFELLARLLREVADQPGVLAEQLVERLHPRPHHRDLDLARHAVEPRAGELERLGQLRRARRPPSPPSARARRSGSSGAPARRRGSSAIRAGSPRRGASSRSPRRPAPWASPPAGVSAGRPSLAAGALSAGSGMISTPGPGGVGAGSGGESPPARWPAVRVARERRVRLGLNLPDRRARCRSAAPSPRRRPRAGARRRRPARSRPPPQCATRSPCSGSISSPRARSVLLRADQRQQRPHPGQGLIDRSTSGGLRRDRRGLDHRGRQRAHRVELEEVDRRVQVAADLLELLG
jgi:hypothetical protein